MRKIHRWRAVAALLVIVSFSAGCRKDLGHSNQLPDYKAQLVDSLTASDIASRITHANMFDLLAADAHRTIESGFTIRDAQQLPALYVFSYADTGFIVIAADRNMSPVLAFSDDSKLQSHGWSCGMENWMSRMTEAVEIVRKGWYDNSGQAAAQWAFIDKRLQNKNTGTSGSNLRPPPDEPCSGTRYSERGPLLPVTWGQGCSYNTFCPPALTGPCGACPTGCVATAMAQVMAFHQRPTTYNWAVMPAASGNQDVAQLMLDAGLSVYMQYTPTSSGAYHSDIDDAFKYTFGYTFSNDVSYNSSQVLGNIQVNHPVILSGFDSNFGGHAWVADGYRVWTNPCFSTIYLHMNWGWHEIFGGDDESGWFLEADWTITMPGGNINFRTNNRAIVDIIP